MSWQDSIKINHSPHFLESNVCLLPTSFSDLYQWVRKSDVESDDVKFHFLYTAQIYKWNIIFKFLLHLYRLLIIVKCISVMTLLCDLIYRLIWPNYMRTSTFSQMLHILSRDLSRQGAVVDNFDMMSIQCSLVFYVIFILLHELMQPRKTCWSPEIGNWSNFLTMLLASIMLGCYALTEVWLSGFSLRDY